MTENFYQKQRENEKAWSDTIDAFSRAWELAEAQREPKPELSQGEPDECTGGNRQNRFSHEVEGVVYKGNFDTSPPDPIEVSRCIFEPDKRLRLEDYDIKNVTLTKNPGKILYDGDGISIGIVHKGVIDTAPPPDKRSQSVFVFSDIQTYIPIGFEFTNSVGIECVVTNYFPEGSYYTYKRRDMLNAVEVLCNEDYIDRCVEAAEEKEKCE